MNTDKKKITFVVNPKSGTQDKTQIAALITECLDHDNYDYQIVHTQYAGHAAEIAAECASAGHHAVVAVGGDGTINEVGRSLVHTGTALGIIPCGSGNGLARHLHIPLNARKAIDVLNEGYIETIDYGKINDKIFFCTCGVGFDAFISLKFANAGKRGPLTYLEQVLKQSLSYQPETYELEIEGITEHYKAFVITCGNAAQYGNNAFITPRASLTDGVLDITVLQPFTLPDVPSLSFQLFNKTIDQNSHIKTFRCKSVTIHRSHSGVAHFDGDPVMMGEDLHVSIIPSGLQVLTPQEPESPEHDSSMLERTGEVIINELKELNDEFLEGVKRRNKEIKDLAEEQIKKLTHNL